MNPKSIKKHIAIIGISGKFPKSENIFELWNNLIQGNELNRFYSDSELEKLGVNLDLINNNKYVKSSSFIEDSGSFDHSFFGYTKEEAILMDPQIRILHEQAWLSLEDSGYNPFNYSDKIGCFLSATDNVNWRTHVTLSENYDISPFFVKQISDRDSISRLISYALNLKGPSYFINTACSSSLAAVHIACRSLLMKECSMALAGGVCVNSTTDIGHLYEEGMIFSRDGHCRAFDIESSGTYRGEGAGIVVLKRLEDALNDGDHIYSIIRSSSVNNDGNQKVGYTAPSIIGQYECIKTAHRIAEIDYKSISYIETHGTGTKLGDPVEIEALNKAFNYDTSHHCAIGSLKSNMGHLDTAAGVASLIKVALSLKNKMIPPSLHFKNANPEINFKSGPFYVNSELKEWISEKPLLAGVSSFGLGGTNVHLILEEPPSKQKGSLPKAYQLLLFSAKTKSSIKRYQNKLKDFLENNVDIADLSYTLKTRRNNYKYRDFAICKDKADAVEQFEKITTQEFFQTKEKKGIVFMFSGQGSLYYRMGKEIYLQFPYFRAIMDEGFRILKNETGIDYSEIIGYNNSKELENDLINDTYYTQPLLFLLEYAFAKLLIQFYIKPSSMIGHSLGEYVAACISGVFTFEEGLKLIIKRAQLMDETGSGSMLSVDLSAEKIAEFISSEINIAAINTESTCVISGNNKSIKAVSDVFSSKDISFTMLKISHASHSQMMDSILNAYEMELNKVNFSKPNYPFISCTTGNLITTQEAMSPKYWVNHLRETVNFSRGLDFLLKEGHSTYIEIGSAKTLLGFLKQNKNYYFDLDLLTVLKHPKDVMEDMHYLLNTLGTVWRNGIDVNWNEYYSGESRNKISVPTYSFDKIIFPSKVNPIKKINEFLKLNSNDETSKNGFNSKFMHSPELFQNEGVEVVDSSINTDSVYDSERPNIKSLYKEAQSETEKILCDLWKSLFGYERVGINDDFFELGGDSLKVKTLLKRIHRTFNIEIGIADFFKKSNIKDLATEINMAQDFKQLNKPTDKSAKSNQIRL